MAIVENEHCQGETKECNEHVKGAKFGEGCLHPDGGEALEEPFG